MSTEKTGRNFFAQRAPKGVFKMGAGVTVNPRTGNPKSRREEVVKFPPANARKNFHAGFREFKLVNVSVPPGGNDLMFY
jgi:hypothetical protein